MNRGRLFVVVVLVVLSGCALPGESHEFDTGGELGRVGDYAADDEFAFETSDGLTRDQLEAVKHRAMARIEVVRGLQYSRDVELEVLSRAEYRDRRSANAGNGSAFRNEFWRGAFVVDGETDVDRAFDDLYGDSVQGYYVNDRIVIVTDDADRIRIDRWVLVHELTHALQDQRFGIARESETVDGVRAENGVIEGEANFVARRYDRRCGDEWQCLSEREGSTTSGEALSERPFNVGLFLSFYAPYAEGPPFVADLYERGGWTAVDRAHGDPPRSTAQVIHPDRYPEVDPVDVAIPDRSSDDWRPIAGGADDGGSADGAASGPGEPRTETVGEATLFATLWANGAIDRPLTAGGTDLGPYNYSHPATAGWAGDSFRVYRNAADPGRTGHVWRLAWESPSDATAFADAYRTLLANRGAEAVGSADAASGAVYRIPNGEPFAGAYRVAVSGETVEIVGAPTVDDLGSIHAAGTESNSNASPDLTPALESAASDRTGPSSPTAGSPRPSSPGRTPEAATRAAADG